MFSKGRFFRSPKVADEPTVIDVGTDETTTVNATFPERVEEGQFGPSVGQEARPLIDRTITSKYDARPSSGPVPVDADASREDIVVDLTEAGKIERKVVIDLTKLPPVDVSMRSDSVYIRHSEGWPTRNPKRWRR